MGVLLWTLNGRWGGLSLMWTEDCNMDVQTFLSSHVDSLVKVGNEGSIRFTGFYGFVELTNR